MLDKALEQAADAETILAARIQRDPMLDQIEEDREACKDFVEFMRRAWHVLEPMEPFVYGWHLGAVAEHLMAITNRQLFRLGINEPPGCMKSLETAVFWPAWEWGPGARAHLRYLTSSYSEGYALRDSRKMRDLVQSEWYQARWPITLLRDGEKSFENTARGSREAKPFVSLTSGRGNRVILDDPLSTEQAESDADRAKAARIVRESLPSRVNNVKTDAIIIIMHRLHPYDPCGVLQDIGADYEWLTLPMEFEKERRCITRIGFIDPRKQDGELLFPERFPADYLKKEKTVLGSYAYAGQYQQRPAPREGGMFKRHWFQIVDKLPVGTVTRIRRWDFAASIPKPGSDPDWSVGLRMAKVGIKFVVEDVNRFQGTAAEVRRSLRATAEADGKSVPIRIPQDPGQAGKDQADNLIAFMAGWDIRKRRESGKKEVRAEPLAAQAEAGNLLLLRGPWNEAFIEELCSFPMGHDDQVDGASGAFNELAGDALPELDMSQGSLTRDNPYRIE